MAKSDRTAIVCYLPVIHAGYLKLFAKYPQAEIWVVDKKLVEVKFRSVLKDIRALTTAQIMASLQALLPKRLIVEVTKLSDLARLKDCQAVILPEDEISQWLEDELLPADLTIQHDSIFLRWSRAKSVQQQDIDPDEETTTDQLHQQLIETTFQEAAVSGDWWRQTAALLVKDGKTVARAHNVHFPSDQRQYVLGDPRANFHRGEEIELSTSVHAEEAVIAQAAAAGISTHGADLYVTTFPCPFCARLIAYSGIKRLFYRGGYSVLAGAELLRSQGVKMIKVTD